MYEGKQFFMNRDRKPERLIFNQEVKNKEREFYSGKVRYGEMIDFLRNSDCTEVKDVENKKMLLDLYQGMKSHEEANIEAVRFRLSLTEIAKKNNKQYIKLKKQEAQEAFENYERKEELEKNEEEAIDFYEKALENWEDTFYIKRHNIETLICDIEYRRAKRIGDTDKREKTLAGLANFQRSIVKDIPTKGLEAEVQLVGLINYWAEKQKKGHLMGAYSALPLDDHKEKIDIEIAIGEEVLSVNLKSYKDSSYVNDFNEALLDKEKSKIKGNRTNIVVLDSDELQEAWRLAGEDEQTEEDKKNLKKLMTNIIRKINNDFLLKLLKCAQKKSEKGRVVITRKQLFEKHSNIKNLIRWGYLVDGEIGDIDSIMNAKNKLKEDLEDDKIFRKLKADI